MAEEFYLQPTVYSWRPSAAVLAFMLSVYGFLIKRFFEFHYKCSFQMCFSENDMHYL